MMIIKTEEFFYGSKKAIVFVLDSCYSVDFRNSIYIYGNAVQSWKLGNVRMELDRRFSSLWVFFSAFYMSAPGNHRICDGCKAKVCYIPYDFHYGTNTDVGWVSSFCIFTFSVAAPQIK